MTSLGLCSTSDIVTFDQNGCHLYSTSAGGKDLSNDTQIRVIGSMEPGTFTKMLKKLSEKLKAKFPATTHGYSMVKFARRDDAFPEFFELEASPVEGQSLQQKGKKRRKRTRMELWCPTTVQPHGQMQRWTSPRKNSIPQEL